MVIMIIDVFEFFWKIDEGDDDVDECDVEGDEEKWGRRWRKRELISCCWLIVR